MVPMVPLWWFGLSKANYTTYEVTRYGVLQPTTELTTCLNLSSNVVEPVCEPLTTRIRLIGIWVLPLVSLGEGKFRCERPHGQRQLVERWRLHQLWHWATDNDAETGCSCWSWGGWRFPVLTRSWILKAVESGICFGLAGYGHCLAAAFAWFW